MSSKLIKFEIQGYKTFASRTEFEFSDRVTAIIGPNGSGKSNIADGLRWVLGEQSYSLLRGKKTVDMIFSGSETRSRAGMASASIYFDNSDNWLPIDFLEVAITRRAYRDGQNEYLLNGQKVRLRDVSELLAQSGLAERTYTVIGQGLVDTALSLRAEERRRLFEEAAGIGLYRSRREEALRRLESTQRNMERVQDIIAELQPRLRSLKRQAKRADEHDRVKADLRVHLLDWYGFHWHKTQRDLAEAKVELREQEIVLNNARVAQQELDQKITGFRDQIIRLRDQLELKHKELSEYRDQHESVSREIAVINERVRSIKDAQIAAEAERSRIDEEILLINQRIEDTENEIVELKKELEDTRGKFEKNRTKLESSQQQHTEINEQVEHSKAKLTEFLTQKAKLDAQITQLGEQITRRELNREKSNRMIETIHLELSELENRRVSSVQSLQESTDMRKKSEFDLAEIQQKTKNVRAEKDRLMQLLNSDRAEFSKINTQLDVLEQADNTFQGYTEGTRVLLKAIREDRLSGGHGALGSYLTIPAQVETAIAAVLGEYLDAILLQDHEGVDQALNELEEHSLRGILIPIDSLDPPGNLVLDVERAPLESDDFLGVAANLIEAPEKFRKAVDLLLGQVLIVRHRAAARKIIDSSRRLKLANLRVVTLKGEVFHVHGPILIGSTGQTVLSRSRSRKELDQSLVTHTKRIQDFEEKIAELERQYDPLQEKEEILEIEFKKYSNTELKMTRELNQVEVEIDRYKRDLRWQEEQLDLNVSEVAEGEKNLQKFMAALSEIDEKAAQLKAEILTKEKSLQYLPIADLQAENTYLNSQVAVLERGLIDLESKLSDLKSSQQRFYETFNLIETKLNQFSVEQKKEIIASAKMKKDEETLRQEIYDLQQKIKPLEEELKALEHDLINLQKNDVETRQALSAGENNYAQARIKYSHAQEKLERLRHKIEDDFGLVEYQYSEEISGPTPLPLEGLVEKLPVLYELPSEINDVIQEYRTQLRRIGPINPEATKEYKEISERITFLDNQLNDLQKAEIDIKEVIAELDVLMEREFRNTFDVVAQEFRRIFTKLFGGGAARLELTEPDDMNETGIEIVARLPGRREQGLSLLSGGERSLTASALIFSLLKVSPPPFCVLDEVDAMLDEANVGRFGDLLSEMSRQLQFIVVTHNRATIQVADVLYGVTMGRDSTSQVISLKMEDVDEQYGV